MSHLSSNISSNRPFRFVHSSDLHLDATPSGMAEIPAQLRPAMLACAKESLVRLVDAALAENVDLVVLAGDVIQVDQASPSTLFKLAEQFERLAEANINVYWAGGDIDAATAWPSAVVLPDTVHRFAGSAVRRITHERDNRPLLELVGSAKKRKANIQPKDYLDADSPLPMIVVAHGAIDARKTQKLLAKHDAPTYWALGGEHRRDTLLSGEHTIHYCGTPQSRHPAETSAHGVTLVEFDQDGSFHTSMIETDGLRWIDVDLEVDAQTTADQLEQMIRARFDELAELHAGKTVIAECVANGTGTGSDTLLDELRVGTLATDMAELLQADYGERDAPIWLSKLSVSNSMTSGAMSSTKPTTQDTILGDFLHTISAFENGTESLDFGSLLPSKKQLKTIAADLEMTATSDVAEILAAAETRGIDLLGGSAQDDVTTAAGGKTS